MAKPQHEEGYTRIANKTMEALAQINLSPYESRVMWHIFRKTYGWNRKTDRIPLSQIAAGTGIAKTHASRALHALVSRSIVTRTGNNQLGIQPDASLWERKLPGQVTSNELREQVTGVTRLGTPPGTEKLPEQAPQKKRKTLLQKKGVAPSEREQHDKEIDELRHRTGRKSEIDYLRRSRTFTDWLDYLNKAGNKVGVLVDAFRTWHKNAPDIDWEGTGPRMAHLYNLARKDAGYLMRVIWELAAADIRGSHLNYIQGYLQSRGTIPGQHRQLPTGDELEQAWSPHD